MQFLNQGALPGAHGPHQIKNLPALFSFERSSVKIANDLRNRLLDAKELVRKEIVNLNGFVLVEPLDMRIAIVVNVSDTGFHDNVVEACVGELGKGRICLDFFQVAEQVAPPGSCLVKIAVLLNDALKLLVMVHSSSPLFWN
jgi:hypothetical protein